MRTQQGFVVHLNLASGNSGAYVHCWEHSLDVDIQAQEKTWLEVEKPHAIGGFVGVMEGDVLMLVFLALEIRSLLHCCCVCKPWKDLIRSAWFRKEWSERHRDEWSSVLLSFTTGYSFGARLGVRRWQPPDTPASGDGTLSPYLKLKVPWYEYYHHTQLQIVASSRGLVCVSLDYATSRYAVGNPVTGEWVHLPELQVNRSRDKSTQYSFEADSNGEFKFQVIDYDWQADYLMIYSSRSRSWTWFSGAIRPRNSIPETAMHDMDERWISIKPPVRFRDGERSSIPYATWWSFKGQTYLAAYIHRLDRDARPLEHLVWKASRVEKQEHVRVTPVCGGCRSWLLWDTGANEEEVAREEPTGVATFMARDARFAFHGEGKLCAFASYKASYPLAPGVYDVSSNAWHHLREFGRSTGTYGSSVFCTRAVVYHPSLIMPDDDFVMVAAAGRGKKFAILNRAKPS